MYRDAQSCPPDFRLDVEDCWQGVERANILGWMGQMDLEECSHCNNPLEGDLHTLIPEKLIAFRGPVQLLDSREYADIGGVRSFAPPPKSTLPEHGRDDSNPAQLSAIRPAPFEAAGIRFVHIDLGERPESLPPASPLLAFLDALAAADGAVAVHCADGLGRIGTVAATRLMEAHGFGAREAIGWIRVVRPGSVVGAQQRFLCRLGDALDQLRSARGGDPANVSAAVPGSPVHAGAGRRCSGLGFLRRPCRAGSSPVEVRAAAGPAMERRRRDRERLQSSF